MSQAEVIKNADIQKRKQAQLSAITSAKAALRSLINDAQTSYGKPLADVDTALLQAHLTTVTEKQEEWDRLEKEIKDLDY